MACILREIRGRNKQTRVNNEIEKCLRRDRVKILRTNKLLLLGSRESGKSTFMKQMKIIHGSGYSPDEKRSYIKHIDQNLFMAMQSVIKAMDLLNIEYKDLSNHENAELGRNIVIETVTKFEIKYFNAMKALWNDPGIQECFERRREYNLTDSAEYYLNNIDRITAPDYLPTHEDIIRATVPTANGIVEYGFKTEHMFRMIDAGGLASDRRKWIKCFEDVAAVMFMAALGEYDQITTESENMSRMEESKVLFKTIISSKYFYNSNVILLLNKKDIFKEKIMVSHLVDYYPEFNGPKHDHILAREFILKMFTSLKPYDDTLVYCHFTCANDTEDTRFNFAAMEKLGIVRRNDFIGFFTGFQTDGIPIIQ